jgi:hypothetical protein
VLGPQVERPADELRAAAAGALREHAAALLLAEDDDAADILREAMRALQRLPGAATVGARRACANADEEG